MNRFAPLTLALVLTLSLAVPALAAEETPKPLTPAQAAQTAAETAATYGGATAVQYALWEDGKITLQGHSGVYSKSENRALTDEHLFGIGSVSKMYTTAAVMQLVEAKKIDLDKPVTTYLPAFTMADQRYANITVRMLLNHSSGLLGSSTAGAFLFDDTDRTATSDLLSRLSTQRLKADPGAFSVYCNDGFTLAELVVEAVSGKEFGDYLRGEIFTKAGLENTFVPGDDFDTSRLVKTYAGADPRALPQDTLGIVGTGGIYASASDLAAFGGALTATDLLSAKSTKAMAAEEYKKGMWPEDDADSLAFGLGWDTVHGYPFALNGIQALAKSGDTLQYHAGLVVLPKYKMAVAVLSSGGVSTYNQMAASQILVAALKEKGIKVDETAPALPPAKPAAMPKELTEFSGYYGASTQQMKITVSEDGAFLLHSLTVPTLNQTFQYFDDGSFRDPTGTAMMLKFVTEENGRTYLWQKAWGNLPGLGLMASSNYLCEKLPDGTQDADAKDAWSNVTSLFPVSEPYTSQVYLSILQGAAVTPEALDGYVGMGRIEDALHVNSVVQIPGNAGRDCQDWTLSARDGKQYLSTSQGLLYQDGADTIYTGAGAYITIPDSGCARWCTVGTQGTGRTMTVTLPKNGGFTVYHQDGTLAASSVAYGDTTVVLPPDGYLVFAGDAGARFHLSFSDAPES